MFVIRAAFILALLFFSAPAAAGDDLSALAGKTNHVIMLRHARAPGTGDPAHFRLGDCSTQRNLSEEGRKQAVRIGPSASNRHPWRVVHEGPACHFFLQRTPGYDRMTGEVKLQDVDMGIALCHFEAAARERGIPGNWAGARPAFEAGTWEYALSWVKNE